MDVALLIDLGGEFTNPDDLIANGEDAKGVVISRAPDDDDLTVFNNTGTITVDGEDSAGIDAVSTTTIENAGTINAIGNRTNGLFIRDAATINNSGNIEVDGDHSVGVFANHTGIDITNTGTISATGRYSNAVFMRGDTVFTNFGFVETNSFDSVAIIGQTELLTMINHGTISSTGDSTEGNVGAVYFQVTGGSITNTGEIFADGLNLNGVQVDDNNGTVVDIVNSGSIAAVGQMGSGILTRADTNITNQLGGQISSVDGDGVSISGVGHIVNAGRIEAGGGEFNSAVRVVGHGSTLVNEVTGELVASSANLFATVFLGGNGSTLQNAGLIESAFQSTVALWVTHEASVTNTGTISATGTAVQSVASGTFQLENSGIIIGEIDLTESVANLDNSGSIDGNIIFGGFNDVYNGADGTVSGIVQGFGGDDDLTSGLGDDTLSGGAGNDDLTGGLGADVIDGGDGNDRAFYIDSDETVLIDLRDATFVGGTAEGDVVTNVEEFFGSRFADNLFGSVDSDTMRGQRGSDNLRGRGGNDFLFGGDGNDQLLGGLGNDQLFGEDGNDTLIGSDGNDRLTGGLGADVIDGGDGFDRVLYTDSDASVLIDVRDGTFSGGTAEGDTILNIENFFGSRFADNFFGSTGGDTLHGQRGADNLRGRAGDDELFGDDGNDTLIGGGGDDVLVGGANKDTFVFAGTWGDDVITDYTDEEDRLDFSSSGLSFDDLTISQVNADTLIEDAFGNSIKLQNTTATDVTEADFLF